MELSPRDPQGGLVREPLVVSQEVGRLQLEIFTAKNLYSMGSCKHNPSLDKHRQGTS